MNPIYSIMESRHRWTILAGIAFTVALGGSIGVLMHGWDHTFVRVWLYAGVLATIYLLVRAFLDWKAEVEGSPPLASRSLLHHGDKGRHLEESSLSRSRETGLEDQGTL